MKLRIRGDSVRLRLKRGEVAQIAAGNSVAEQTHFPGSMLRYCLDVSDGTDIRAEFSGNSLVVTLPAAQVSRWAGSDDVSLASTQTLEGGETLDILVEKDFACLSPSHGRDEEDDADTFPHPEAATRTC
ncbi:MAG TPA: hypothetical protein VE175_09370 [Woeseiaceae bacterium]|jgi:hypothetical protein|nr:hypothetical protein [Woeseiaceae bacterium]